MASMLKSLAKFFVHRRRKGARTRGPRRPSFAGQERLNPAVILVANRAKSSLRARTKADAAA